MHSLEQRQGRLAPGIANGRSRAGGAGVHNSFTHSVHHVPLANSLNGVCPPHGLASVGPHGAALCTSAAAVASPFGPSAEGDVRFGVDLGYPRDLESKFIHEGKQLGQGGNGTVTLVRARSSNELYACKSVRKVLPAALGVSERKCVGHIASIKREVEVLQRLRGSLNVVELHDVFEDDDCVHMIMTYCAGGELWRRGHHYSERTVASYMRAILRTIAQCHSHHILHRDIKPGNFMLLNDSDRAPLLALDFGLAMPFDPEQLPRSDLGLEGTPWFMAPEVLSASVSPASDVWSAGVTAFQLLTGRVPFDDHRNPTAPAVSAIWRSILTDKLDLNTPCWSGISQDAKDFVTLLLQRDPSKRPTARDALQHPWLKGSLRERTTGQPIGGSVVQRLQRWSQASRFKRTVLQSIAAELLSAAESAGCTVNWEDKPAVSSLDSEGEEAETTDTSNPCAILSAPGAQAVQALYSQAGESGGMLGDLNTQAVADALRALGFRLDRSEVRRLIEQLDVDTGGRVDRAALAASQLDWRALQRGSRAPKPRQQPPSADRPFDGVTTVPDAPVDSAADTSAGGVHQDSTDDAADLWLTLARRAFTALDQDADGVLKVDDLLKAMRPGLPDGMDIELAVADAMREAGTGAAGAQTIEFEDFLVMLRARSTDSLDLYDDRHSVSSGDRTRSSSSTERLNALLLRAGSISAGDRSAATSLDPSDWSRHGASRDPSRNGPSRDPSRHGPDPSRNGSLGMAPLAAVAEASTDSAKHVNSPPWAAVPHGNPPAGTHGPGAAAGHHAGAPPPKGIVWRFQPDRAATPAADPTAGAASKHAQGKVVAVNERVGASPAGGIAHPVERRMHGSQLYRNAAIAGSRAIPRKQG